MEWEIIKLAVSLAWAPFVAVWMAKRKEDKEEKDKMSEEVRELRTSLAVLQKTAVTEVSLRDYIASRFKESDSAHKKELERLETKIDSLSNAINAIAQNMPKRKGDD